MVVLVPYSGIAVQEGTTTFGLFLDCCRLCGRRFAYCTVVGGTRARLLPGGIDCLSASVMLVFGLFVHRLRVVKVSVGTSVTLSKPLAPLHTL